MSEIVRPNAEMLRLRDMLYAAGIEWHDDSNELFCRTNDADEDCEWTFSAVCGPFAYGTIELWTRSMRRAMKDPRGYDTAEEVFELIRAEVGE